MVQGLDGGWKACPKCAEDFRYKESFREDHCDGCVKLDAQELMEKEKEIMDLQPGRELDKLVAEKILGFDVRVITTTAKYKQSPDLVYSEYYIYDKRYFGGKSVKRYSTDISVAWEVIQKMRENTHWFGIDQHSQNYRAIFRVKNRRVDEDWFEAIAPTVSEAICKAALLATIE